MIQIDLFKDVLRFRLTFFIVCLSLSTLFGQKDYLKEANSAFNNDSFREALIYFNRIDKIESSAPLLLKRGICHYEINRLDEALIDFQRAWEYGSREALIDYYTGRIQHHKGNFNLAADYYKKFLANIDEDDIRRASTRRLIKQCGRAIDLSFQRPIAIIEKLPRAVNTAFDEIGLVESFSTTGKYYFTSNKPNLSSSMEPSDYDVYWTQLSTGVWSEGKRMPYAINQRDHEILLGFTDQANGVYFYRGKGHQGEIVRNSGSGNSSKTTPTLVPSSYSLVNSDAFFFSDQVVFFSSREFQGYGGYDLYASYLEDGVWSDPVNLGPEINSKYDEVSPYLEPSGSELYFSSDRDESIGGLDVFTSNYLFEARKWGNPVNLGIPINSPGDDTHFGLSYDGLTGMLTSDRKIAFGGLDVFLVRFVDSRSEYQDRTDYLTFLDFAIEPLQISGDSTQFEEELIDHLEESQQVESTVQNPLPESLGKYEFSPFYYNTGQDLDNEENQNKIDDLIKFADQNPMVNIHIDCHTKDDGILEYKLYSSIKIAERLQSYLVDNGISEERIFIKGFADNYPLALSEKSGGDIRFANLYNSRIEISFSNFQEDEFEFERSSPEIPEYSKDRSFDLYQALIEDGITYKIQIAVVSQMYRGMSLEYFNDTTVEEDPSTGLYAYTIGLYDSYADALRVKRDMDRFGITDAQVVVYYDGLRIGEDQYSYYVNRFPDLKSLMNYNR